MSDLHIKINKLYLNGLSEAFKDAGIDAGRTLEFKTKEEKKRILRDYLVKNPNAGGHTIRKDTKINFLSIYKNTEEMFEDLSFPYPRKNFRMLRNREKEAKRKKIIEELRKNPLLGVDKIGKQLNTHPHSLFKNVKEIYELAGIPYLNGWHKRKLNKRIEIVNYIRKNPFATQREINNSCKTHVQLVFDDGIFEAYEKSGTTFPYQRLKLHGAVLKEIKNEARLFEEKIAKVLSGYGAVSRLVRTKRGFADIILERKNNKVAIELKNYKSHEISISQIKQLNKYLEDIGSNLGFLICLKKPKKDNFLIGRNRMIILEESELFKIPEMMDRTP
ncbi:MAG: hypothetical protein AABW80_02955 [Nanoarchaeota archaeon]